MKDLCEVVNDIKTRDNVYVFDTPLNNTKCCTMKLNGNFFIGIDMSQICCNAELRSRLYHEIGHCETDSLYNSTATRIDVIRAEHQAVKWAVQNCVPFDKYIDAIRDGVRDVWQLSEYFDITVESARKVIEFYECRLIHFISLNKGVKV